MSMFSSRPPFNDDPHPNVWEGHSPRNQMRADTDMYRRGAPFNHETYAHRPRPEFNRPQHNPTNPILTELRANKRDIYDLMLDLDSRWAQRFSEEQIAHARDVLTRLANLTIDKEN